jgi:hypothetical protein
MIPCRRPGLQIQSTAHKVARGSLHESNNNAEVRNRTYALGATN